jgi:hypothetical protein
VSVRAIEAEVQRRGRTKRRAGIAGIVVIAAALGTLLPFALSGSPQGAARLNVTPPPQPSPSVRFTGHASLQVSWAGQPRDGATATLTGAGFSPGTRVLLAPCQPQAECTNPPVATVDVGSDGTFRVRVTAHLVIDAGFGQSFMCARTCSYSATSSSGQYLAKSDAFDLVALPPDNEKCSWPTVQLLYVEGGPSAPGTRSAVFKVKNTGARPCWLFGPGEVGLDLLPSVPVVGSVIDQSAPGWPPKIITLAPGDAAQFTVTKPACRGTSVPLPHILFGDINNNEDVQLPSAAQAQLALCTGVGGADPNRAAAENIWTITDYTAG